MSFVLQTDGGSRGNPGPSAAGWVIFEDGVLKYENAKFLGIKTNNYAEYSAIVEGLKEALSLKIDTLEVKLDSELATKQINGIYKVKNDAIREFIKEIEKLKVQFKKITFSHVYRSFNKDADRMVNKCLDSQK